MNILQMSITAAILIIVIVVIRALAIHKLPKKTFLVLWGVVLLRLLTTFSIPSPLSIYTVLDKTVETQAASPDTGIIPNMYPINAFISPKVPDGVAQRYLVLAVWIVGMVACALFFLVTHLRCRREYKAALPVENGYINGWLKQHKTRRLLQIRQSDRINSPLTYGIWKPVILLPKTTNWQNEDELRYVLVHELTHIKRFDVLTKCLIAAALSVHWFNPLVWVMYVLANRDIELTCDETVVRTFGETVKSAYALALIELEEKKNSFSPLCNNFAKNAIEERIVSIMKMKRTSMIGIVLAIAVVMGTATAFATTSDTHTSQPAADKTDSIQTTKDTPVGLSYIDETGAAQTLSLEGLVTEYWTYEQYKVWVEQEKERLQALVGTPMQSLNEQEKTWLVGEKAGEQEKSAWYDWSVWTQEDIDTVIASLESELERVKNGMKVVKTVCLGPFDTEEEMLAKVVPFNDAQVRAGIMTQAQADESLEFFLSAAK